MLALPAALRERLAAERDRRRTRRRFRAEDLCRRGRRLAQQQLAFITDPARWKVACCSRRAGKTHACAILLLDYALRFADSLCLYVTLTRVSGKRIVWRRLNRLNAEYELGGVANRAELTLTFPNGSTIMVAGAKDEAEADKLRGIDPAPRLVVIDEAQAFKDYVRDLVDDVLVPMLVETKGTMVLIGTPGKVRSGYFYEACQAAPPGMRERLRVAAPANDNGDEEETAARQEWSVHHWTINDNPFIDDVEDELAKIRKRKAWTADHPTYQREYLGRWVPEHDALVYKYDQERNGYTTLPERAGLEWRCVLVVDQGFYDADAIGALWFRPQRRGVWLEELHHERKASAGQLAAKAHQLWLGLRGRCLRVLWDEGGGGAKVAEDARLLGVPAEAVEKGPGSKVAGIERTNTALVSGALKIPVGGQAAADAPRVQWDPKARGVRLSERYHTDMWDVCNYGLGALVGLVPLNEAAELDPERTAMQEEQRAKAKRIAARADRRGDWLRRALGR